MGNDPSQQKSSNVASSLSARALQLQELQDISSNYLDHLEKIIDSRETHDPRVIIEILKHNLKTVRQQINKISSTNSDTNDINRSNKSSVEQASNPMRFSYDWCEATTEQIQFDSCKLGRIDGVKIATSTFNPVVMSTISQDSKCRIWKLRSKSKHYEIVKRDKNTHYIQTLEANGLQEIFGSYSNEIKEDEYIADLSDSNGNKSISYNRNKSISNNRKSTDKSTHKKELYFELSHEIQLSVAETCCLAIHCKGNKIAIGTIDAKVRFLDISCLNKENTHKQNNNPFSYSLNGNTAKLPKKQRSLSKLFPNKKKKADASDYRNKATSNPSSAYAFASALKSYNFTVNKVGFEVESTQLFLCELCFWKQYISCMEFLNDDQHIIIGSGDGTLTICNYKSMDKICSYTSNSDVICVDYLYLDSKASTRLRRKSPLKKRKAFNKTARNKENVTFDGVPVVAGDFDDGDSSDSGNELASPESKEMMSANTMYKRVYDDDYISKQQILLLIGTACNKDNKYNVYVDEMSLSIDEYDKLDIVSAKKNHLARYKEKRLLSESVQFCYNLGEKRCETLRFSPNGKFFAIGGECGKYEIYDRISLKQIHERYTNINEDVKKRKKNDDNVTCLAWINEHTVAVGTNKGEFVYISTILNECKIRNFVMKEWLIENHVCDDEIIEGIRGILEEIHECIGSDVIDNVIRTDFGQKTSCLTSHPYFSMNAINNNTANQSIYNQHTNEGLCVSASWSSGFHGCVLKD